MKRIFKGALLILFAVNPCVADHLDLADLEKTIAASCIVSEGEPEEAYLRDHPVFEAYVETLYPLAVQLLKGYRQTRTLPGYHSQREFQSKWRPPYLDTELSGASFETNLGRSCKNGYTYCATLSCADDPDGLECEEVSGVEIAQRMRRKASNFQRITQRRLRKLIKEAKGRDRQRKLRRFLRMTQDALKAHNDGLEGFPETVAFSAYCLED